MKAANKFKSFTNWKRNAIVTTVLLFLCTGIYLNWSYQQQVSVPDLTETLNTEGLVDPSQLVLGDAEAEAAAPTNADSTDYFATVRLSRQESRDRAVNTLQETMAYEDQPEKAALCAQSLDEIVNTALEEAEIESLVIAKGYTDCVTYISDDVVSVAVSAPAEGLKENDVALISDVVTSQTDFKLSDVRIIEVK